MRQERKENQHFSKHNPKKDGSEKSENVYLKYTGLGFQMIATILLGVWAGIYLDEYFETINPWFTVGLSLFGVIASIYLAIKELIE